MKRLLLSAAALGLTACSVLPEDLETAQEVAACIDSSAGLLEDDVGVVTDFSPATHAELALLSDWGGDSGPRALHQDCPGSTLPAALLPAHSARSIA